MLSARRTINLLVVLWVYIGLVIKEAQSDEECKTSEKYFKPNTLFSKANSGSKHSGVNVKHNDSISRLPKVPTNAEEEEKVEHTQTNMNADISTVFGDFDSEGSPKHKEDEDTFKEKPIEF